MARVSSLGEVAAVRHVVVRFDAAGVPFGEPRLPDPMVVACEEATPPCSGRWFDARTWAQDFRRPLPPGSRCSVRRRGDWQPLGGAMAALPLTGSALLKAGELKFAGYEVCSFVPPQAVEAQPVESDEAAGREPAVAAAQRAGRAAAVRGRGRAAPATGRAGRPPHRGRPDRRAGQRQRRGAGLGRIERVVQRRQRCSDAAGGGRRAAGGGAPARSPLAALCAAAACPRSTCRAKCRANCSPSAMPPRELHTAVGARTAAAAGTAVVEAIDGFKVLKSPKVRVMGAAEAAPVRPSRAVATAVVPSGLRSAFVVDHAQ